MVTYQCNHYKVAVSREDGSDGWKLMRDSCPAKGPHLARRRRRPVATDDADERQAAILEPPAAHDITLPPTEQAVSGVARINHAALARQMQQRTDATVVAHWLADRRVAPRLGPLASERFTALRERVRCKEQGNNRL